MMLVASAFVGLSVGCFIVFGYQRIIVYRKFSKVIKATQKNLDACIENKSKLIKLEKEIESQLETLNKISQQSELTNIPVTKTLKDSNLTIDNTRNDLNI